MRTECPHVVKAGSKADQGKKAATIYNSEDRFDNRTVISQRIIEPGDLRELALVRLSPMSIIT
jgi:hypothetical protein